ncbi:DUF4097 family beta strand repeat-containing protein [Sporosarcina sp. HYO08]|uniref:DUF4097 family beta strand repeat-containing protein n=1 Tax=Sporosarcina sp. HYO08 TaxID=1759557 RepID=UPI00079629A5|nr:DUF4097 family beta strand repeat-containing protein [Sporosarcina sp. HYO08]KXH81752.1 hypothetical protein AU377_05665 [Sporosarcina sp. HYO08]
MTFQKRWLPLLIIGLLLGWALVYVMTGSSGGPSKKEITKPSFSNIDLKTSNASVEIVPTKKDKAIVSHTGKKKLGRKYRFQVKEKGDTLVVVFKEKGWSFFNLDFSRKSLRLTVQVPEKQYASIKVLTDNGQIEIGNMKSDQLMLRTDNGRIQLTEMDVQRTDARTDNGQIALTNVSGEIKAKTDNGKIQLTADLLNQPIQLKTDNGRIEIRTKKEPKNVKITARTDNGRVKIYGEDTREIVFGNGKSVVQLQTDNGSIIVEK